MNFNLKFRPYINESALSGNSKNKADYVTIRTYKENKREDRVSVKLSYDGSLKKIYAIYCDRDPG